MKKYMICLLLFLAISLACAGAGYLIGKRASPPTESTQETETEAETETVTEDHLASNQRQVLPRAQAEEFYLVAEDGFLLVFLKDQKTICLYTHVPLVDFPMGEQDRLREGIWFSSMMEVFHYLESYTS